MARSSTATELRSGSSEGALERRALEPELLDELRADDPRARRSRAELRRLNACMGHARIAARALRGLDARGGAPLRVVELGAGEGVLWLSVLDRLGPAWHARGDGVRHELVLVDRIDLLEPETRAAYEGRGWSVRVARGDALEQLRALERCDVLLANLFVHHLGDARIAELFALAAQRARFVLALEPRRAALPLALCRALPLLGCGAVTRHDARLSVRAGFRGEELSGLWPRGSSWQLEERRALVSHLFVARAPQAASRGAHG